MWFFTKPYKIKPIFYVIKKYGCIANICGYKKMCFFGVIYIILFSLRQGEPGRSLLHYFPFSWLETTARWNRKFPIKFQHWILDIDWILIWNSRTLLFSVLNLILEKFTRYTFGILTLWNKKTTVRPFLWFKIVPWT